MHFCLSFDFYMCACVTLMICVYKRRWSIWKTCLVMASFEETTWNTEMNDFFNVVSHRLSDRLNTWPGQEGNTPEDKGTWFYSSIFLMSFLFYYYFPRILISEDFNIWRIFETQAKNKLFKNRTKDHIFIALSTWKDWCVSSWSITAVLVALLQKNNNIIWVTFPWVSC